YEFPPGLGDCSQPGFVGSSITSQDGSTYCEVKQLTGDEGRSCRDDANPTGDGWCYIDPARGLGAAGLVQMCAPDAQRRVRFVGAVKDLNAEYMHVGENTPWWAAHTHCDTPTDGSSNCPPLWNP